MERKEIIDQLLKDEPIDKGHRRYLFIAENSKINENLGFVKIEVYDDNKKKALFKVKISQDLSNVKEKIWSKLKNGEKSITTGYLELSAKDIISKIKEGFNSAVGEGRIPFFPNR